MTTWWGTPSPDGDPLGFRSALGDFDLQLFGEGRHYRTYEPKFLC